MTPKTPWVTAQQAADQLGLTIHQVYRRIIRGDLRAVVHGSRPTYWINPDDLADYKQAMMPLTAPKRDQRWMRVHEVALRLGFTPETVRKLCREEAFEYIRGSGKNGHFRISRRSVDAYEQGTQGYVL